MKAFSEIPDNSMIIVQGHQLKAIMGDFEKEITKKIEHMGNPARSISVSEAAELIGVSPNTVKSLIKDGHLEGFRNGRGGRNIQLRMSQVIEYVESKKLA